MYPVSDAFLRAVRSNTRKYFWTGTIVTKGGMTYEFGAKEIVKGSGYISRQCCGSTDNVSGGLDSESGSGSEISVDASMPVKWQEDGQAVCYVAFEFNNDEIVEHCPVERKLDTVQGEAFGSGHKGKGRFLSGAECKMLCEEGISVCAFL